MRLFGDGGSAKGKLLFGAVHAGLLEDLGEMKVTSDRTHRIGQQRPVTIYRMILAGTIEEKISELHATKRDLAESLLEGTDRSGKLTTDELLQLIKP